MKESFPSQVAEGKIPSALKKDLFIIEISNDIEATIARENQIKGWLWIKIPSALKKDLFIIEISNDIEATIARENQIKGWLWIRKITEAHSVWHHTNHSLKKINYIL